MADNSAHYKRLTDRFEERAKLLVAAGFKYELLQDVGYDCAVYTRPRLSNPGGRAKLPQTIQSAFVMNADDICWHDEMDRLDS